MTFSLQSTFKLIFHVFICHGWRGEKSSTHRQLKCPTGKPSGVSTTYSLEPMNCTITSDKPGKGSGYA